MSSKLIQTSTPLKMAVARNSNFTLRAMLVILCLCAVQAAPLGTSPPIKSTMGEKGFNEAIASDELSFVKFFHPGCPHCQAMAKDFDELAFRIADHNRNTGTAPNHTIAVLQVDASKGQNHPVISTHASAFPTLKLFRSGKLIVEYSGPREAKPMYEFLMRALQIADHPLVTHLHTAHQVKDFLTLAKDRPVVISLFQPREGALLKAGTSASDHFPEHIQLSLTEWEETVKTMHEHTAPQTVFATVPHPDLLISTPSQERFDWLSSRHSIPPLLAAAPRADDFNTSAKWYFPVVRDGAPLSSFMHTAIIGSEDFVTLSKHNSPYVLETTRPLAIAFGQEDAPSFMEENFLVEAANQHSEPKMLPIYTDIKRSRDFAEHVGLNISTISTSEGNLEEWKSQYVIYRFGNQGPVSAIYSDKDGMKLTDWLKLQTKNLNGTDTMTFAGEVLELDLKSWQNLFEFDSRGVLLVLYRTNCAACKGLLKTSTRVAAQLQPYSQSIVVATFDMSKFELPSWPKLPKDTQIPKVLWVAPGETPAMYDGYKSSRGVARFAMEMSGLRGDKIDWVDVILSYLLVWGSILTFGGVVLYFHSRSRPYKREHIT